MMTTSRGFISLAFVLLILIVLGGAGRYATANASNRRDHLITAVYYDCAMKRYVPYAGPCAFEGAIVEGDCYSIDGRTLSIADDRTLPGADVYPSTATDDNSSGDDPNCKAA